MKIHQNAMKLLGAEPKTRGIAMYHSTLLVVVLTCESTHDLPEAPNQYNTNNITLLFL